MAFNPASNIQDCLTFGEFGGVNPSITDSVTYTFLSPDTMEELFNNEIDGCYLYSRHWLPTNRYLSQALAAMEGTESAQVTASGMSAIACTILQLCQNGDEIITSRTIYGGTYALFKNLLPRFGICVKFVDITNHDAVKQAITSKTRILYTETESNPLLEVADIPTLANIAHDHDITFIVDNTFTPMIFSPAQLGADIVIYSMTKFINGTSDAVAGAICGSTELIQKLTDVLSGTTMLLGPVLDSMRSASLLKNLHTLHIRMRQHSHNAYCLARQLKKWKLKVHYPGLPEHPQHLLMKKLMRADLGFGGMLTLDAGTIVQARKLMQTMQEERLGYLAVSLGYFKTLFSAPGSSTSSEIPPDEQKSMGLTDGLIRFSIGLDDDIARSLDRMQICLQKAQLL